MKIFLAPLAFLTVVATVVAVATAATAIIQESQFDAYLTEERRISSFQVNGVVFMIAKPLKSKEGSCCGVK